ncbi:hypothetical protein Patl1_05420 [Pistacia atlantica]|uniref:Uncharacterized protein n=1 Tax=Pistacia atlantica TaxID=434234 RepID=A0ACC1BSP2_9ROSI|nr:hypothetical protein Patl1_05420 [Pistacia atlantica]
MAEAILFSVAGKILEGLGSLAVQEDAKEQHNKNREVTAWIQRLKDAFYDADDLLDDFFTQLRWREILSQNVLANKVRIFFSKSNQIAYSVRMAHKIKTIREKLDEIKKDRPDHLLSVLLKKES